VRLVTSPVTAQILLGRTKAATPVEVAVVSVEAAVATLAEVAEVDKSATSVDKLATSLATALKAAKVVDMVEVVAVMAEATAVVAMEEVNSSKDKLATLVVATDTCPATAPRAKSATTVVRLAI